MEHNIQIIKQSGLLDGSHANELRQRIIELVKNGTDIVLIDCQDVTFMNSSGIGALVATLKTVRAEGGDLFLCSLSDQVKMIFELTKMNRVFQTFRNATEFQEKVGKIVLSNNN